MIDFGDGFSTHLGVTAKVAGATYDLNNSQERLIAYDGLGLSNTRRLSQRAPTQDGDSDLGRRVDARFVSLFWQSRYPDLITYYAGREKFEELFRARDNDPIQLIFDFADGSTRALDVNLEGSFDFPSNDRRRTVQKFGVTLKASDYRLYDPTINTVEFFLLSSGGGLPIPFTIPIPIGRGAETTTQVIYYANGSRLASKEYPLITVYGPIVNPIIENLTTNEKIDLSADGGLVLTSGQFITIDLNGGERRDSKPIRDQDGNSVQNYLTTDSQLLTWHLSFNGEKLTDGTYSDGNNEIRVSGSNVNLNSRATLAYYNRYEGK